MLIPLMLHPFDFIPMDEFNCQATIALKARKSVALLKFAAYRRFLIKYRLNYSQQALKPNSSAVCFFEQNLQLFLS